MKYSVTLLLAIAVILSAVPLKAEELSHIPGAYVDIGFGARPMGMGGAFTGLADDRNAVVWNPAGLLKSEGSGISFMWAKQLGLIPYNYLSYSRSLSEKQRIGGALIFSGDDLLSESTAMVAYAVSMDKFHPRLSKIAVAANLKIRWASFGNNTDGDADRVTGDAFGYGFDLGLMYFASNRLSFGMLYRDFLNGMSWSSSVSGDYSESVPAELSFGAAYRRSLNTVLTMDVRKSLYQDTDDRVLVGIEQRFFQLLLIRAGWGANLGSEYSNQEIAFGLGLNKQMKSFDFSFDFAYVLNDLKNTPRAGVTLNW